MTLTDMEMADDGGRSKQSQLWYWGSVLFQTCFTNESILLILHGTMLDTLRGLPFNTTTWYQLIFKCIHPHTVISSSLWFPLSLLALCLHSVYSKCFHLLKQSARVLSDAPTVS